MPGRQPQASSIISAARNSPPEAELPSHFQSCRWLPCRHYVDLPARSQPPPLCLPLIRPGRVRQVADVFSQRFFETKGALQWPRSRYSPACFFWYSTKSLNRLMRALPFKWAGLAFCAAGGTLLPLPSPLAPEARSVSPARLRRSAACSLLRRGAFSPCALGLRVAAIAPPSLRCHLDGAGAGRRFDKGRALREFQESGQPTPRPSPSRYPDGRVSRPIVSATTRLRNKAPSTSETPRRISSPAMVRLRVSRSAICAQSWPGSSARSPAERLWNCDRMGIALDTGTSGSGVRPL